MNGYGNVEINVFSILLLIIIYNNMHRRGIKYMLDQKLYLYMVVTNIAVLIFDSIQWIVDGKTGETVYYIDVISCTVYYAIQVLPVMFWCDYVRYEITMDFKETVKSKILMCMPFVLNALLSICSCFSGLYFIIDKQNVYHRGEYFWVSSLFTYSYFLYSIIYVLLKRKKTEKNIYILLLLFSLPPVLGSFLQIFYYGYSIIWPGVTVSLIMIYINIQKNQLYTDYLTGLYNRRLMDIHLEDCLSDGTKHKKIGVIMLDIDKFKSINDRFGHVAGDQALVETADIIKKSIGEKGFASRYGGDEFVIILPADDLSELDKVASNIDRDIKSFNENESALYKLSLSMGYELFDCGGGVSKNDVINTIDRRMYKEKALNHELNVCVHE